MHINMCTLIWLGRLIYVCYSARADEYYARAELIYVCYSARADEYSARADKYNHINLWLLFYPGRNILLFWPGRLVFCRAD